MSKIRDYSYTWHIVCTYLHYRENFFQFRPTESRYDREGTCLFCCGTTTPAVVPRRVIKDHRANEQLYDVRCHSGMEEGKCWLHTSPRAHLHVVGVLRFMSKTETNRACPLLFFKFCSSVSFCLYSPFNCISFHKFSRQLSAFSLCSSGLVLPNWSFELYISL